MVIHQSDREKTPFSFDLMIKSIHGIIELKISIMTSKFKKIKAIGKTMVRKKSSRSNQNTGDEIVVEQNK